MVSASSSLLLLACTSLKLLAQVTAHGYLTEPPARNSGRGPANGYCPQCGNGRGVCGDGGQFGSQSNFLAAGGAPRRTYTAGELVTFKMTITANHGGHMKMYICNEQIGPQTPDPEGPNGCLSQWVVQNPSGGSQWGMPSGSGDHTFQGRIPETLQCDSCTLQWRWWTDVGTGEMFRNCADIKVLASGTPGPSPTPQPMPTPAPSPTITTTVATISSTTAANGCMATGAENYGGSDAACTFACQQLPADRWPCGTGHLCDCSSTPKTTTDMATTTFQGKKSCVPTPGLPPNGATTENCGRCADGYQWWPCNTSPAICTCTGGSLVQIKRSWKKGL